MKRGPTQATMKRLFAERTELVTDWIPCTTPPVRDGVYEVEYVGDPSPPAVWRSEFKQGDWINPTHGQPMNAMRVRPQNYRWRGVRRWVLVHRNNPIARSLNYGKPLDVYLVDARPSRSELDNRLVKARPFRTKRDAQRFADRYSRLGLVAVLP